MVDKKEEVKLAYNKVDIATQTSPAIQDKEGKVLMDMDIFVEILNRLERIERAIV